MDQLNRRYVVEKGTIIVVSSMLKRKIQSGSTNIRWFVDNCMKVRQNTLFKNNQSQLYKELGGKANSGLTQVPNAREVTRF